MSSSIFWKFMKPRNHYFPPQVSNFGYSPIMFFFCAENSKTTAVDSCKDNKKQHPFIGDQPWFFPILVSFERSQKQNLLSTSDFWARLLSLGSHCRHFIEVVNKFMISVLLMIVFIYLIINLQASLHLFFFNYFILLFLLLSLWTITTIFDNNKRDGLV